MNDNQLLALIRQTLINGESWLGIPGTPIAAGFQPTQQGVNTAPTAYIYKVGDQLIGQPYQFAGQVNTNLVTETGSNIVTEGGSNIEAQALTVQYVQIVETTFQINALSIQDPSTPTQYTASDLANFMVMIIQSQFSIATLQAQGVGILKVGAVRNPYFQDDFNQFEANPSFDLVVTHNRAFNKFPPVAETYELLIYEI